MYLFSIIFVMKKIPSIWNCRIWEKVWLEPNFFPYKYPNILKPSHSSHLPTYEDGTDSAPKRRYIKFRHRGGLPRRRHTTFRTGQKFEIKNTNNLPAHVRVVFTWTVWHWKFLTRTRSPHLLVWYHELRKSITKQCVIYTGKFGWRWSLGKWGQ